MSSLMENSQSNSKHSNLKKVLRTALVGVKPSDQILLKGYLRVLLRLEADLEWVSASHPQVDLFMISNEFRQATSIVNLLAGLPQTPVLYISRTDIDEGWVAGDRLVLPLKKIDALNEWLMQSVTVLKQNAGVVTTILQQNQIESEQPAIKPSKTAGNDDSSAVVVEVAKTSDTNATNVINATQAANKALSNNVSPDNSAAIANMSPQDYQGLITFIQQLQQRPTGLHKIIITNADIGTDGNADADRNSQTIAIIEPWKGRVWLSKNSDDKASSTALSHNWHLKPYQGPALIASEAYDLTQWLWQQAWYKSALLLPLVSDDATYQLRYWIKPTLVTDNYINNDRLIDNNSTSDNRSTEQQDLTKKDRQELLRVMTALGSSPYDVNQLAGLADISVKSTKKIIASLLFSGSLQQDSYTQLDIRITRQPNMAQSTSLPSAESRMSVLANTITDTSKPTLKTESENKPEETGTIKGKQTAMEALLARRARGETSANAASSSVTLSGNGTISSDNQAINQQTDNQSTTANQAKRGFLSRLRQKLGL